MRRIYYMKLLASIKTELSLDSDKKYLIGCSFGPDSMCLLKLLILNNYNVCVAHVNYKTRTNSDEEETKIVEFCSENDIKIYVKHYTKHTNINFEADARFFRYDFFKDIYEKEKCDFLLTGHHADDSIETYLFNKLRNSTPTFEGILYKTTINSMNVLRPLLCYQKSDILSFCNANKIPYSIDYTNYEDVHTRNKIRHKYIDNMNFDEKAKLIKEIDEKNEILHSLYKEIKCDELYEKCDIKLLHISDDYLFSHALFNIISNSINVVPKKGIVDSILIDIRNSVTNKIYKITNNYSVSLEYGYIQIIQNSMLYFSYNLNLKDAEELLGFNFKNFVNKFPSFADQNLRIMPIVKGKKIDCDGISKSVNRFLIDCKIPHSIRNLWPGIFKADGNILYTPRYRQNYSKKEDSIFDFSSKNLAELQYFGKKSRL